MEAARSLKGGLFADFDFDEYLNDIRRGESTVCHCLQLVERDGMCRQALVSKFANTF